MTTDGVQLDGWDALNLELFTVGTHAQVVERAIKRWWRNDIGLPAYLTSADQPRTRRWSETISIDGISAIDCIECTRLAALTARTV